MKRRFPRFVSKAVATGTIATMLFSPLTPALSWSVAHAVAEPNLYGTTIKDAWVDQADTSKNHGDDSESKVKSKDNSDNRRTLVAFSLPSLPSGATVQSATLKLFMKDAPSDSRSYDVYRNTADWVEGDGGSNNNPAGEVTWANKPATAVSSSATAVTGKTNNVVLSWNVTADVAGFYTASYSNYGWTIRDQNESSDQSREGKFRSREHSDSSQRPVLEITYTLPTTTTLTVTKVVTNNSGGTKVISDFPLFLDGMAITSGVATTTSTGFHTISETNQAGYSATITGDCASDGTITLAGGSNKACTITNDDQPGHLTIVKNTVGGDGSFGFTVTGPTASTPSITTVNASSTSGSLAVSAGTYSVAETAQTGWDFTSAVCDNGTLSGSTISGIVIPLNGNVTCAFTNTKRGSITVKKDVVNPDGGAVSDNHSFTIHRDSEEGDSISEESDKEYNNLVPGTYTIVEDADSNYDFVSFSQDADSETAGAQITIAAGEDVTLTITNKQKKGTLTVIKNVTNHEIGTSDANDFSFSLNGGGAISFIAEEGAMTGQNVLFVNPGAFTVTEPVVSGYAESLVGCSGTLTSSSTATCTITNSDIPTGQGAITVVKSIINDNGGDAVVGDFDLFVGATSTVNGAAQFLNPGSYVVNEGSLPSGYSQTSISCTNGVTTTTDGSVTLGEQDAWVCTITNDDQPGTLHVVKTIVNNYGGTATSTEFSFSVNEESEIMFEADGQNDLTVDAGTYSVAEFSDSRYTITYASGENSNCTNIVIANGGEATCTITNTAKPAQLEIVKHTDQLSGDGSFNFNVIGQESLSLSTEGGSATSSTMSLNAGSYDVTETIPEGWALSSVSCLNGETPLGEATTTGRTLSLQNGDSVTCTFTNTMRATLTVKKIVVNDNNGTKVASDFTFKVNGGEAVTFEVDGQNDLIVNAGSYSVTEPAVSGYTTTYENCSEMTLTNGGSATCTITNNDIAPESAPTPSPSPTPIPAGNGPIAGSFGFSFGGGSVLGTSTVGLVLGTSTPLMCTTEHIKDYMRRGGKNNSDEVKKLQQLLNENLSLKIPTTGFFGPLTFDAVKKFQIKYSNEILAPWVKFGHPSKEVATGNVYKMTKWWINALKCQPLTLLAPQLP